MPLCWSTNIKSYQQDLSGCELQEDDRLYLVRRAVAPGSSVRSVAKRHCISYRTLNNWVRNHLEGKPLKVSVGAPLKIDKKHYLDLLNFVNRRGAAPSKDEFGCKVETLIKKTADDRGKGNYTPMGPRYADYLSKKVGIVNKIVDVGTSARLEAEVDTKNCVSTLCFFTAILKFVSSIHLLINYDFTQFHVSVSGGTKRKVCLDASRPALRGDKPIKAEQEKKSHELDIAIKWFAICNMAGQTNH